MKFFLTLSNKLIIAASPFIFLMAVVVSVFTPAFIWIEYQRPGFPPDEFGFSTEERLRYGIHSVNYVTSLRNLSLAELTGPDSEPLYRESELSHMADVRTVFQSARWALAGLIALTVVQFALTWRRPGAFRDLLYALRTGALASIVVYSLLMILSLTIFDQVFYSFHQLFFAEGSWLFYTSDALIRLFPKQLWVDAFIVAGVSALALAVLFYFLFRAFAKRAAIPPVSGKTSLNAVRSSSSPDGAASFKR